MISLREFHDVFKSINPWESDAEAFVRTDADGIVYVPSSMIADEEQRQAACDEMDEEGSWISFPDASELRLGKDVALRYAERFLSENDYERVVDIFYRRGAFRRFKDLLDERGKLEEWYAFEEISELAALKEWLTEKDITYVDDCTLTEEAQKLAALLEQEG